MENRLQIVETVSCETCESFRVNRLAFRANRLAFPANHAAFCVNRVASVQQACSERVG